MAHIATSHKKRPYLDDNIEKEEDDDIALHPPQSKRSCLDIERDSSQTHHLIEKDDDGVKDKKDVKSYSCNDTDGAAVSDGESVDISDPVQRAFIDCLLDNSQNAPSILVTGGAGVGKTFLVKYARKRLIEDVISKLNRVENDKFKALAKTINNPDVLAQCESAHNNLLASLRSAVESGLPMTAYTAAAATLLDGGCTLHHFMGMGLMENPNVRLKSDTIQRLKLTRIVFVDEVSMLHPKQLMIMDIVLRRYLNPNQPFGGIRFVFIGDFAQLAPIVKHNDDMLKRNGGTYDVVPTVFDILNNLLPQLRTFCFKRIFRQASDPDFAAALNRIRLQRPGELKHEDAAILISRQMPLIEFCKQYRNSEFGKNADERIMPTIVCPRLKQVASHNRVNLNKLTTDDFFFPARYIYTRCEWMLMQRIIADGSATRLLQIKHSPFVYDTRERADVTRAHKFELPHPMMCVASSNSPPSSSDDLEDDKSTPLQKRPWYVSKEATAANNRAKAMFGSEIADGDEEDTTTNPYLSKRTFWIDNSLTFGETYMVNTCAASLATPAGLHLKVGAQVTLTANINPKSGLFNGQRGVVTHICTSAEWARIRAEEAAIRAAERVEREGRGVLKAEAAMNDEHASSDDYDEFATLNDDLAWPVVKFVNGAHRIIRPHLFEMEVPGLPTNRQRRVVTNSSSSPPPATTNATSSATRRSTAVDLTLDAFADDEDAQLLSGGGSNSINRQSRVGTSAAEPISLDDASTSMVTTGAAAQPRMYGWLVPLELAWSTTVHKAQGRTLTFMYIDIGPTSSRPLQQGLLFVALSRVQHRQQFAISSFHIALNTTDPRVNDYYEKLHEQAIPRQYRTNTTHLL